MKTVAQKKKPTKTTTTKRAKAEQPIPYVPAPQAAPAQAPLDDKTAERHALRGVENPPSSFLHSLTLGELITGALNSGWTNQGFADGILDSIAAEMNVLDAALFDRDDEVNSDDVRMTLSGIGNRARYGAELARRIAKARKVTA